MTLRTAVYARRSTDEGQEASLLVQTSQARAYIEAEGWVLEERHVYIDDAISRAEFVKRPGLNQMLQAAKAGEFDAIVVRDETRLGGDLSRTYQMIMDLIEGGVRLFYYFTRQEITARTLNDQVMVFLSGYSSAAERQKTSERTYEHLRQKALKGYCVGGRVYGYDVVQVGGHKEYRINEEQAKVVPEIFERYSRGEGLRSIARVLNDRGIECPQVGRRGLGFWVYSSLQPMLRRETYSGVLVWNKTEKKYVGGTKVRVKRPEEEWIRVEVPDLRIVPQPLWEAVQARLAQNKRMSGTPGKRGAPKYLLSSRTRCGVCGGPVTVANSRSGTKTIKVYTCGRRKDYGKDICSNSCRRPVEVVDDAVLAWINDNVLSEQMVKATMKELRRRLEQQSSQADVEVPALRERAARLKEEIGAYTDAILTTKEPPHALVKAISERETQLKRIEDNIKRLKSTPPAIDLAMRRMENSAAERIGHFRTLMKRRPAEAGKVLEAILVEPLVFKPIETSDGRRAEIQGPADVGGALFLRVASPTGFEPVLPA